MGPRYRFVGVGRGRGGRQGKVDAVGAGVGADELAQRRHHVGAHRAYPENEKQKKNTRDSLQVISNDVNVGHMAQ